MNKVSRDHSIVLPIGKSYPERDLVKTDAEIQAVLRVQANAEIHSFEIPMVDGDMFRRRIVVTKTKVSSSKNMDLPDMSDVHETTLPWVGVASFRGASRQFRRLFCLAVVVDTVFYYGGYLYSLKEKVQHEMHKNFQPMWVSVQDIPGNLWEMRLTFSPFEQMDEDQLRKLDTAPKVPLALAEMLKEHGYVYTGNGEFMSAANHPVLVVSLFGGVSRDRIREPLSLTSTRKTAEPA